MHDDIAAVGDAQRLGEVLLGHQHREIVVVLELLDGVDGAAHQKRRQTDRGLVDQKDAGIEHERARQRQHLLLAAAHGAGKLAFALGQARENLEAEIQIGPDLRARLAAGSAQQQVFFHGLAREQAAAFRYQRDAEVDDLLGGHADQIVAVTVDLGDDLALARPHHAHHAFHQRALAVAVGAEQHHGLAAGDGERDVLEHPHRAVGGIDFLDRDAVGARCQDTPPPLPGP